MRILLFLAMIVPISVLGQTTFDDVTVEVAPFNVKSAGSWGSGVTAEDYDGDGDIDLVMCSDATSNPRLHINKLYDNGEVNPLDFEQALTAGGASLALA